jgi:CRP-like cAMP-binding protein
MPKQSTPAAGTHVNELNLILQASSDGGPLAQTGFQLVPLTLGEQLVELGSTMTYAYFPTRGVISLLSSTPGGNTVEVAAIGHEGVAAPPFLAGVAPSPFHVVVQVEGSALRINHQRLATHLDERPEMRERLLRFLHTLVAQISQSAVCNRFHTTRQRLARWLLFVADRAQRDTVPMTHEVAALMVGSTRPRVTAAIQGLRRRGFIEHRRGEVSILDREGLSRVSCDCYDAMSAYFADETGEV